jgi:hypothetical protein
MTVTITETTPKVGQNKEKSVRMNWSPQGHPSKLNDLVACRRALPGSCMFEKLQEIIWGRGRSHGPGFCL